MFGELYFIFIEICEAVGLSASALTSINMLASKKEYPDNGLTPHWPKRLDSSGTLATSSNMWRIAVPNNQ